MKSTLFIVGLGAGLLLAAGSAAAAGVCTAEIENLEKTLATADAGMGPTGTGTGTDAVTGVAPGAVQEEHPPTDVMNQAAEGKATSPDDVLQQNQGAPTDSDAAEAGQMSTAAGIDEATDSLQRAKELDQKGDEAACMAEIAKVKGALGLQ
ncbi:MAG TPA: hypothetical protein VG742_11785 [Dongiaceae bacterium]|nr:hypothetical protein [Dongiaceae bacterium]